MPTGGFLRERLVVAGRRSQPMRSHHEADVPHRYKERAKTSVLLREERVVMKDETHSPFTPSLHAVLAAWVCCGLAVLGALLLSTIHGNGSSRPAMYAGDARLNVFPHGVMRT